jgi:hypothetical protein
VRVTLPQQWAVLRERGFVLGGFTTGAIRAAPDDQISYRLDCVAAITENARTPSQLLQHVGERDGGNGRQSNYKMVHTRPL